MILLTPGDIGYFHVLDYYLARACKELAAGGRRQEFWFTHPARYCDGEEERNWQ